MGQKNRINIKEDLIENLEIYELIEDEVLKFMKKDDKNFKENIIGREKPCDICDHYPSLVQFTSGKNVCPICYYKFFRTEFQNKLLENVKNTTEREIFYEFSKQIEKMKRWGQIES